MAKKNKRSNKKDYVRQCAARLFLKMGYNRATMDMVAEETGLNKGTLYYYYSSKSEILFDIYQFSGELVIERTTIDEERYGPIEGIRQLMLAIVQTIHQHQVETTIYFQEEGWLEFIFENKELKQIREAQKQFYKNCRRVIERAQASGDIRDIPVNDAFHALMGMTSWTYRWMKPEISPEQIAGRMSDILLDGLRA